MTKYTNALLSGCKNSADMKIRILSPILNNNFSNKKEFNQKITQIACDTGYSKRTLIRWYESYQKDGFEGLEPKYPKFRSDSRLYIRFDALKNEAKAMRMQDPTISVNNIIQCLESKHPNIRGIIKRSTLQRHLQVDGYSRKELLTENEQNGRAFYSRYKVAHRMIQVQGDIKEPPRGVCVDEQGFPVTPYVQIWMDNFSRKALTWKIHYHQTSDIALSSLRELIETYGIPEIILTDQGSIYRGAEIEHCTHVLGISHKRSKPYCPQSKGALERLNGTIDDLFRSIKLMKNVKFSMFCELVNQRLNEYNNTPHSA
ncbi:MAG: DDE-type integrase/transposase/recombinase, partial [Lactobacillus sp.]